jgi:hypothetical protein
LRAQRRSAKIVAMMRLPAIALVLVLASCQSSEEGHGDHARGADAPLALPPIASDARVFFVSPADGAVVRGPLVDGKVELKVEMGARGVAVEPAGEVKEGSGHHHVIIDAPRVEKGMAVPTDDRHVHFGKGQTDAVIPLEPGRHELTLQFADGAHRSYGPALASSITVTVEIEGGAHTDMHPESPE